MTILVVGAGATGGYFGALLAQAGRDVTFLVRPHRAEQLRERGLRIVGPGAGAAAGQALRPSLVMAGELAGPADVVLLSVKASALDQAIADFAPAVGPRTAVVPFLNGCRGGLARRRPRGTGRAGAADVHQVRASRSDRGPGALRAKAV